MEIIILIALVILNAVFVVSEIALISARRTRIETLSNKGDLRAKKALRLIDNPELFLSTAQIGITLIAILTGVYSGEKFGQKLAPYLSTFEWLKPYAEVLSTTTVVILVTFVSIVFGELVPKKMGMIKAEKISLVSAGPMLALARAVSPFVWLLSGITNIILKILNIKQRTDSSITEEEIKALITEGSEQGSIEEDEKEIIERVFHLGDRNITSLMTHRTDIVWVDVKDSVQTVKEKLNEVIYSTYPVCDGVVDEIKGLVYVKDLLKAPHNATMKDLLKPALFVPENNKAYQLLEKFKSSRIHACFIVNEYGTLEGMITLNDILEAIVGDVPQVGQEEYQIVKREDGSYLVDAQISFYDFLAYFDHVDWISDLNLEFDTLAGFILDQLEHIPHTGEHFSWKEFKLEVIDMDGQRIDKILVHHQPPSQELNKEEE
jgi:putative hemolysin